jgi:hypothetical protein
LGQKQKCLKDTTLTVGVIDGEGAASSLDNESNGQDN